MSLDDNILIDIVLKICFHDLSLLRRILNI